MRKYISPKPGTMWRFVDDDPEYLLVYQKLGVVKTSMTDPNMNGEGEVTILYSDGGTSTMKVRRFVLQHEFVKYSKKSKRNIIALHAPTIAAGPTDFEALHQHIARAIGRSLGIPNALFSREKQASPVAASSLVHDLPKGGLVSEQHFGRPFALDNIMHTQTGRFVSDRANVEYVQKSPTGLEPRWIHEERRIFEIKRAIGRYKSFDMAVPPKWHEELDELEQRQLKRRGIIK